MSNIQPVNQVIQTIETPAFKEQLKALLPAHVKPEQFLSVARRGILNNKGLDFTKMDKSTLYASCLKAAEQGLKLDGEEAALVQYGANVQFMKMIKGIKKQMRNSGEIKDIMAEVVHKNDKFRFYIDENGKHLTHEPNYLEDRGDPVAAYSIISTKDGGNYIKVMSKAEIMDVKAVSKSAKSDFSPWNGPFGGEMWCKTVLRRNAKDAPTSTDIEVPFKEWDADFDFQQPTASTAENEKNPSVQKESPGSQVVQPKKKSASRLETVVGVVTPDQPETIEDQIPI